MIVRFKEDTQALHSPDKKYLKGQQSIFSEEEGNKYIDKGVAVRIDKQQKTKGGKK